MKMKKCKGNHIHFSWFACMYLMITGADVLLFIEN